jgi:hypothetical protein
MTKALAIGGHAHGQLLPLPQRGHRLSTMPPLDMSDYLTTDPAPIITMPEVVDYQVLQFGMRWLTWDRYVRAEQFPVLVVAGMDKTEAEVWMRLVVAWFTVWGMLTLTGIADYLAGLTRMHAEADALSRWAGLLDEMRRLLDEQD